jgi:hypothetical protein
LSIVATEKRKKRKNLTTLCGTWICQNGKTGERERMQVVRGKRDKRKGGGNAVLMQTNTERERVCMKGEKEITSIYASALIDPIAYKIAGAGLAPPPIQAATGWKDKKQGPGFGRTIPEVVSLRAWTNLSISSPVPINLYAECAHNPVQSEVSCVYR